MSKGSKHTIDAGMVNTMAREMNLKTGEMVGMVTCTLSREGVLAAITANTA